MSKFNNLFKKIISECKLITENGKYDATIDIPRPNKMKTPENYYGSTGGNAKEYNLYIQDEAEAVFQDKYGRERGTRMWENIIGIGNAMWKACDEILGERLSMEYDITEWFNHHPDIANQCTDRKNYIDVSFYNGSYIVDWVLWILIQIIDGKHFTTNYINNCIETFKGVANFIPITSNILLSLAGIDINKSEENIQIVPNIEPIVEPVIMPQTEIPVNNISFELNGEKDHDRIIGILQKSKLDPTKPITIDNIDHFHATMLANTMNKKITDSFKRERRAQACNNLGLDWLAKAFK